MRTVYVDTSVLLKYYVEEKGTADVRKALTDKKTAAYTSEFTYVEALAYVARQRAMARLNEETSQRLIGALRQDIGRAGKFGIIRHGRGTLELIEGFAGEGEGLRTVDLIHLAAAVYLSEHRTGAKEVLTADQRMGEAVRRRGLEWIRV